MNNRQRLAFALACWIACGLILAPCDRATSHFFNLPDGYYPNDMAMLRSGYAPIARTVDLVIAALLGGAGLTVLLGWKKSN
jgi:hypothetical protein